MQYSDKPLGSQSWNHSNNVDKQSLTKATPLAKLSSYCIVASCCSCSVLTPHAQELTPESKTASMPSNRTDDDHDRSASVRVGHLTPDASQADLMVRNAQGQLTTKASAVLLKKRWRGAYQDLRTLAILEQTVTGNPLIDGNQITLLHDGPQTMAAMIAAIKTAKKHIHLETYIFDQDPLGDGFAKLLMERQAAGVQVRIIYDSVGTLGTPQAFFDALSASGIELLAFHPFNPVRALSEAVPWSPNQRDHRKLLVVDGQIAFTGGINISNSYATSSLFRSKQRGNPAVGWRDTHIQMVGPAVAAIQWVFLDTWLEEKKLDFADLPVADFFPLLPQRGTHLVRVLASGPQDNQDIYQAYLVALNQAQHRIHITCAYFVPDKAILAALGAAVKRGVDVRLILPGVNDNDLVSQASKSYFAEMLEQGVQLFQLKVAVLHAKTAVIDGQWSTVGSTNIDTRSFLHNREINVVVYSPAFGQEMESAFAEDLRSSIPVSQESWAQRSLLDHIKQWLARRLAYWL
nr:cardiolipin synthase [uncultured Undibacterium sp.]